MGYITFNRHHRHQTDIMAAATISLSYYDALDARGRTAANYLEQTIPYIRDSLNYIICGHKITGRDIQRAAQQVCRMVSVIGCYETQNEMMDTLADELMIRIRADIQDYTPQFEHSLRARLHYILVNRQYI